MRRRCTTYRVAREHVCVDSDDRPLCGEGDGSLTSRRRLIQAAGGSVLAASGLWLPAGFEEAERVSRMGYERVLPRERPWTVT
jgi:hypothetical protein